MRLLGLGVQEIPKSGHADKLVPVLSSELGLAALGGLVGEHREGGGEERGHSAGHRHPVGAPQLALAEDEGVSLLTTDVLDPPRAPASGVSQQPDGEQHRGEHLY